MIDRAGLTCPDSGDGGLGRAQRAGRRRRWWRAWSRSVRGLRPQPWDVLLAAVIALVQVAGTIIYSAGEPSRWAFGAGAFVLLLAGPAAVLFHRRWPEATLMIAFAAAAGYAGSGYPRGPAGLPAFVFVLVSTILIGRRKFAWRVLAVAYPALTFLPFVFPDPVQEARNDPSVVGDLAWLLVLAAAAEIVRSHRDRRAERAQAARAETRRRAGEERLRIARELHDVLAHNISLINVQSAVALHLLDERPEQTRPALEAINAASEEALGELRSALEVLRTGLGDEPAPSESGEWVPRAPTAGLRELDGVVQRTRAAGFDVELAIEGEVRSVPAGVDLAAFRVVQEALTNVVRHAGGEARATVRLGYGSAELVVQVDDDGRRAGPAGGADGVVGRGIAGMQERVTALGGTFSAGPRPAGGFRVRAQFPLPNEMR